MHKKSPFSQGTFFISNSFFYTFKNHPLFYFVNNFTNLKTKIMNVNKKINMLFISALFVIMASLLLLISCMAFLDVERIN